MPASTPRERDQSTGPAYVCNAQGDPADGWLVDAIGDHFAPIPIGTLHGASGVQLPAVELDGVARDLVVSAGHEPVHGLGHGVGLEIHERPFLVPDGDASPLRAGMSITIEPGIYVPGQGGVRIEDTLLVGPEASESLTRSPRELIEV